jgi:hypothetical protein
MAVTADGGFLIGDMTNNRVRFVDADLRFPRGPAGPVGRAPLALAFADTRLSVPARRRVTLRYAATERARVLVRVVRGGRTLKRARGQARGGANRIEALNGGLPSPRRPQRTTRTLRNDGSEAPRTRAPRSRAVLRTSSESWSKGSPTTTPGIPGG